MLSERENALNRETRALLAGYQLEADLDRILDEIHNAQAKVAEQGDRPRTPSFGRTMHAAWQVRRGDAFWDRAPADPVPLRVAE